MAGRSQSFLFSRVRSTVAEVFERIDDLCRTRDFEPTLAQALAWPQEIAALAEHGKPTELGYERDAAYGPSGEIVRTPTHDALQRFVAETLGRPVIDAGVSVDYAWTGQAEMFTDYRSYYDGGPSWCIWPESDDCTGLTLSFFAYARALGADPRLHAFSKELAKQTADAIGSDRYQAIDDASFVTLDDYRGAPADRPFQR